MREFRNILVGVDLSQGDLLVSDELAPPSREAVRQALWLAELNDAELHFFFALDVCPRTRQLIDLSQGVSETVVDKAHGVLADLVGRAGERGISARGTVLYGKSWLELVRQALRDRHDLVIVGTRHLGRLRGALIGSTGMQLLRKCPCPVWITEEKSSSSLNTVLVATDFSPVCDRALDLAASMAKLHEAQLGVLHVFDLPEKAHFLGLIPAEKEYDRHRERLEEEARENLRKRLERPCVAQLDRPCRAYFKSGATSHVVMEQIEHLRVDLLVMGTVARSGIPGILIGNTAERLFPQLACSLLAVKPEEFQSPVRLD